MTKELKLPTSVEIEHYHLYHSRNTISLAVDPDFTWIHGTEVPLVPIVRREGDNFFYYPHLLRRLQPSKSIYPEWGIPMVTPKPFAVCYLDPLGWESANDIRHELPGSKAIFRDADTLLSLGIRRLNAWLLRNVALLLDSVRLDDSDIGSSRWMYRVGVWMKKGGRIPNTREKLPSYLQQTDHDIRVSLHIMMPSPYHDDVRMLDAALRYEKRTDAAAMRESSLAYAGCVDVIEYKMKLRNEYVASLKKATPEFRAVLGVENLD